MSHIPCHQPIITASIKAGLHPAISFSWALKKIISIFPSPREHTWGRINLTPSPHAGCISTNNILHESHPQLLIGNEAVILSLIAFRMHNVAQDCKGFFIKFQTPVWHWPGLAARPVYTEVPGRSLGICAPLTRVNASHNRFLLL